MHRSAFPRFDIMPECDRQKDRQTDMPPIAYTPFAKLPCAVITRAHHRDEKPERDLTYHLTCLLIYHETTIHL